MLSKAGLASAHVLAREHGVLFHGNAPLALLMLPRVFLQQGQHNNAGGQHGLARIHIFAHQMEFQVRGLADDLHGAARV